MAEYLVSDPAIQDAHPHTQYDLIANICHEGEPGKGKLTHFLLTNLFFINHTGLRPNFGQDANICSFSILYHIISCDI